MTYLLMSMPFIAAGLAMFAFGALRAHRHDGIRRYIVSWGLATIVLLILTAVFDNIMMAAGFFDYGPDRISGLRLGLMPVEDFLYPIAGSLLLAGTWEVLGARRRKEAQPDV